MQLDEPQFFNPFAEIEHTKNHLPHWQQPGVTYLITFRLSDAVPTALRDSWQNEREAWLKWHPKPWSADTTREYHEQFSAREDQWLDAGHGECILRDPRCRANLEPTLRHFDGERYHHHAWVIMPNHVHVLVSLCATSKLGEVVGAWKGISSKRINALLGRGGTVWQEDYFDRFIRDGEHFANCCRYVRRNPLKAGLSQAAFTLYETEFAGGY